MKILALDIATKTGFATDVASGVWDLKLKKGESNGMKLIRLNSKVREVVESLNIDLVAMERPAGLFKSAIITESELIGVVKLYCEEKNINYILSLFFYSNILIFVLQSSQFIFFYPSFSLKKMRKN